ncbi:ABC transporter ATP-binding protein [Nonomuraea africana]|uniref:ABC-2 type transport system ATP-binding protein n=1 Tax=Nonomuraea africana TaxID=46171 RepID=A0ABR9K9G1_9ACTN|nr:ABC transporter ATP-binding protein [Nonomuraea africana]MBE1558632.1 ABC-2 type transport system ATP-binding protein [Nonomuraea africana]
MTAIRVNGLRRTYGRNVAVDDVSFTVGAGETLGVVGHNGAGKTTTVECLSGLRRPDAGSVEVLGLDPARHRRALAERIGVQLQEAGLPDRLKVAEALRLFAAFYRRPEDWRKVMERWGLAPLARKAYGDLSGGQRQRLQIALALVGRPELVILDELTTGLDPVARRETWALVGELKTAGVTVVLVSHFMDEAEALCDRIAVFVRGRIASLGTPAELMTATGTSSLDDAYLELVR